MLSGRGVVLSASASIIFAALGWYSTLLRPLDGMAIVAWRIIWTVPAMVMALILLGQTGRFKALVGRVKREPRLWWVVPLAAFLMFIQQWIFMWAPQVGRLMEVSLGYFLLPLVMVLIGFVFYHERPSRLQWLAVAFAIVGVLHELWLTRAFSWVTLVTAVGYPPYLMLRRWIKLDPVAGFLLEVLCIVPFVAWYLLTHTDATQALVTKPALWGMLPLLGIMTASAFAFYLAASKLLPMGVLGILGYVEPVLLFFISILFLGEPFTMAGLGTYVPIWIAVLLTCGHSALTLGRQRNAV
ncbi:chloramphenicol-sensitive protein RarD [Silvimonas terrae]|uniref:Chloramphenicol-sensitive protein RarD n=1 Tax=Silvimonas terrae TaxID=300266 RepID=A0A840RB56_9NEIS|nr:EamA family transporter RarD [Silvimonas terrae]MBB5189686.1 chloramphenicol-sensitive protein RarD [Silvimonas terrae]